jgi:Cu(I)/Ag(I) efflux system periplasmic protein CusF
MPSRGFYLLVFGLGPIALTACVETEAATAQPASAVPAIGVDLGNSARIPQIAGLAGEGEGYGRTEPGTTPTAHNSMPGMDHGSTSSVPMDHGSMPGMTHGSMSGMQMDHGVMSGMSHRSMRGVQMDHGAMPGMSHGFRGRIAGDRGEMPGMSHPQPAGGMKMAHSGHAHAQGTGTVNSVDVAAHRVNVSHGPIPAIGFPSMTMDFAVAPSVDLQEVKPGIRVNFTIEKGEGGMYVIQSIAPASGSRR